MVGRRLREHECSRTVQLKLRYTDFSTSLRAHSLDHATQLDTEIFQQVRALFRQNRKPTLRSGCWSACLRIDPVKARMNLLAEDQTDRCARR